MAAMAILAFRKESLGLKGVTIPRYLSNAIKVCKTTETHTITSCNGPTNWHKNSPRGQPLNSSAVRRGVRTMATNRSAIAMFIKKKLHGVHMLRFPRIVTITMVLPISPVIITKARRTVRIAFYKPRWSPVTDLNNEKCLFGYTDKRFFCECLQSGIENICAPRGGGISQQSFILWSSAPPGRRRWGLPHMGHIGMCCCEGCGFKQFTLG